MRKLQTWSEELDKVVLLMRITHTEYLDLKMDRDRLVLEGYTAGWASQIALADMTNLSRGRIQQLLQAQET